MNEDMTKTRTKKTVRCHDCIHAELRQNGNDPAIARCRADTNRPPQVALARIVCNLFEPDIEKLPAGNYQIRIGNGTARENRT